MNKIKLFVKLVLILLLSNCGYSPIYSNSNLKNKELQAISVKNIKDRSGQILKANLTDKLNPNGKKSLTKYSLEVVLSEGKETIGYRRDKSATRSNLILNVEYDLKEMKGGTSILKKSILVTSSYDIVESLYATIVAEKDARNKGLKIISDNIVNDLAIFFKKNNL